MMDDSVEMSCNGSLLMIGYAVHCVLAIGCVALGKITILGWPLRSPSFYGAKSRRKDYVRGK